MGMIIKMKYVRNTTTCVWVLTSAIFSNMTQSEVEYIRSKVSNNCGSIFISTTHYLGPHGLGPL